jgi:hypothetical protein
MKRILIVFTTFFFVGTAESQNEDSLYFRLSIDSCSKNNTILNTLNKEFDVAVKNSSAVFPMFKQDDMELGFKIYVNRIIEDEKKIIIVKVLFMEKYLHNENWKPITKSEYYPLDEMGNQRSLKIGSDKIVPDFFIQYKFHEVSSDEQQNKEGILDLIPALKEKAKKILKLQN